MTEDLKKREALKTAYSSPKWISKVNKMSEAQVTAVYLRLKSQNRL